MCEKRDTRFYSLDFIVRKMLIHKMQQQVKYIKHANAGREHYSVRIRTHGMQCDFYASY